MKTASSSVPVTIRRMAEFTAAASDTLKANSAASDAIENGELPSAWSAGTTVKIMNLSTGSVGSGYVSGTSGALVKSSSSSDTAGLFSANDTVRVFWEEEADGGENREAVELTISPDKFPGNYRVIGDALVRDASSGKDSAFQFVIGNAKLASSVTLTMQAEGDPSTFSMTLNVLKDKDGEMMKLIRY